ncbi:T6SS immunity protein Tdi1 domain-containing protein [Clostridium felsineum]|uniref:Uncharacterized protein n=1 Tax=Clostridium felsineum TaxID=36839 RepID=A0A1S8LHB6_9CLOT|nr:T6SS immunity protein Tdi1 domain-containing protein [Clostridium felsineum]URZ03081.1 hypothetical protein CLAUR_031270 [Clostridium felsineum]URZ08584.1 hypothetical protein CLROS_039660 [Clostridium felsineum]URZ13615.1 hypothetical protein CROST_043810 [Clostridium felsineum]
MKYKSLEDFKKYKEVEQDTISLYNNKIPKKILDIWREYGFGSFMKNYIKIINPSEYKELLDESYFRGKESIPVMVTGLGDIITWEKNRYLSIVKYRKGTFDIIEDGFEYFLTDIMDTEYVKDFLDNLQYEEAVIDKGILEYDECFGYVPLLGLGGSEKVENLKKVKIKEHIELITQLVGKIE